MKRAAVCPDRKLQFDDLARPNVVHVRVRQRDRVVFDVEAEIAPINITPSRTDLSQKKGFQLSVEGRRIHADR